MKDDEESFRAALAQSDWEGMARAFQEGNIKWHADEWKSFIENIRQADRASLRKEVENLIKTSGKSTEYEAACFDVLNLLSDTI